MSNKPVPFRHLNRDYDQETIGRAVELVGDTGNIAHAHRTLKPELEAQDKPVPSYSTIYNWVKKCDGLLDQVRADKKQEIINIYGEAAILLAEEVLAAIPDLTPYQRVIAAGVITDKFTNLSRPLPSGAMVQFQVNLRTGDDAKPVIEGEAKDVTGP